jgi:hypothetical protein
VPALVKTDSCGCLRLPSGGTVSTGQGSPPDESESASDCWPPAVNWEHPPGTA